MLVGKTPFAAQSADEVYVKIQNLDYAIPEEVDPDAADLIIRLLKIDPRERLGMGAAGGKLVEYEGLKAHPFFTGIDFEGLDSVQVPMPPDLFATYKKSLNEKLRHRNSSIFSAVDCENSLTEILGEVNAS